MAGQTGSPQMAGSGGGPPAGRSMGASQTGGQTAPIVAQAGAPHPPSSKTEEDFTPKVKDLYHQLRKAFEAKEVSGITECISNQWQANDGTNLTTLRANLTKSFAAYDDIRCAIQGLKIEKGSDGKYKVNYDLTLSGKNGKKSLKQEEKSRVSDEVAIESGGKPKIVRTLSGKFWYSN